MKCALRSLALRTFCEAQAVHLDEVRFAPSGAYDLLRWCVDKCTGAVKIRLACVELQLMP